MLLTWWRSRKSAAPVATAVPVLPAGVWPVLPCGDLLHSNQTLVTSIKKLVGTSPDYWAALYQPLLDNFAAFVQQTPASEAHHHCYQGGMLTHSLQVMELALKSRKGRMLPPGAAAETVNEEHQAWTFAVASAALLHDAGKPCSDQKLRLFNTNGQDTHAYWQPLQGALQSGYYQVQFVRDRQYRTHELLPPLLARQLTPVFALSWLQKDFPEVFKVWLAYLSGQDDTAGLLGQMVTDADMESVSNDLMGIKAIHTQQIPTARVKPLSQRLLTGLRHLLDEQQLPLNRPGAAGFFDGDSLWLVSKRVLDDIRNHLEKEGQTGIPSRNDRLMDELQQHNILTPTVSGQAIWNATVKAGTMEQSFTLLRIPASTLWADTAQFPKALDGTITPAAKDGEAAPAKPKADKAATTQTATVTQPAATAIEAVVVESSNAPPEPATTDDDYDGLLPTDPFTATANPSPVTAPETESPWDDDDDLLPPTLANAALTVAPPAEPIPIAPTTIVTPKAEPTKPLMIPDATGNPDSDDTGERFLHWLSDGLRTGKHPVNVSEAFIHTVKEGVLLVSPRAFQLFAPDNWEYVQKRFAKLGLHRKAPGNSNIWLYEVRGQKKSGVVRGFLLANPLEALGVMYLPAPNKSLSLPKEPHP